MTLRKEKVLVNGEILELDVDDKTGIRSSITYIGKNGRILGENEKELAIEFHITEYDEHNHPIMHHKFIVSDKHE